MSDSGTVKYVDVDLVRRVKAGDLQALEELFHRYQKRVYNIVYGIVGDENDAAELTQDVFVRVFESVGTLRTEQAFLTWLRRVAVNLCRDHLRRRLGLRIESIDEKLSFEGEEMDRELPDSSNDPARALDVKETRQAVQRAIDSLSDEHRAVVTLHHTEGMNVEEIADALGCPTGTVKSRLARAREELRRKLAPYVEV